MASSKTKTKLGRDPFGGQVGQTKARRSARKPKRARKSTLREKFVPRWIAQLGICKHVEPLVKRFSRVRTAQDFLNQLDALFRPA